MSRNTHSPTLLWLLGKKLAKYSLIQYPPVQTNETDNGKWTAKKLKKAKQLYLVFPNKKDITDALCWSHYQCLMRIKDRTERNWYLNQSLQHCWTVRQLKRQVKTQFFERHINQTTLGIKTNYHLEFTGKKPLLNEREMENALVNSLQELLLEFGSGFSFVARQQQLKTATGLSYFIDLILYHIHQRCTILIELKITSLSHRDIGQLDTYVRLYDDKYRRLDDEPTIGLLLCPAIDSSLLQYSVLADNPRLFAAIFTTVPLNF